MNDTNGINDIKDYSWKGRGDLQAMSGEGDYRVYLRDVFYGYGEKRVIGDVDLAIRAGEFVTMVGPSGCGKSTLLRLLLGEERAQQGIVRIDGKPRTRPDADCGVVYQKYSVFPHLTVLENITAGPILSQIGVFGKIFSPFRYRQLKKQVVEEARVLLQTMGLEKEEGKYPHQLSGGMQQRVAIAQAIIMHPKVLLLDEPFSALDPWTRDQLQQFLIQVWMKECMTIVFVTHDLEEAIYLGTRIMVLSQQYVTGLGAGIGARIVADLPISAPHPRPVEFKSSEYLNTLLLRIRRIAFEKKTDGNLIHIGDFLLEHSDSFHTAPQEEWKRN